MDFGFKGKTALVTGAGSQVGFGKEIALLLAAEGIDAIAVTAAHLNGAQKTAEAVKAAGARGLALEADICDNAAIKAMVAKVIAEFGRIDILCNVAGGLLHEDGVPLDQQDPEIWEKQFKLSVVGTMNVTQAVISGMRAQKYGSIVNIGSDSTHALAMGVSSYAMSKYAVELFTKQLAFVEARNGIRVNCVAPGPAETNFSGLLKDRPDVSPELAEKMRQEMLGHFPLGRIATPWDIATATIFLASEPAAGHITGQIYHVSGGSVI